MNKKQIEVRTPFQNITNTYKINKKSSHSSSDSFKRSTINNKQYNLFPCSNHPAINSSYFINQQGQTLLYCSNCNVHLKAQGFITSPIDQHTYSMLQQLKQTLENIDAKKLINSQKQKKINQHYKKSTNKITIYKQRLIQKIQNLFASQLQNAKQQFNVQLKQMMKQRNELENSIRKINNTIQQIKTNIGKQKNSNKYQNRSSSLFKKCNEVIQCVNSVGKVQIPIAKINNIDKLKQSIEQSLVINEGSNNLLFSLAQPQQKKKFSYDDVRLVQSLNEEDFSLQSIVEYKVSDAIKGLF